MSAVTSSPAARAASIRSIAAVHQRPVRRPPDAFRWYTSAAAPERRAISMPRRSPQQPRPLRADVGDVDPAGARRPPARPRRSRRCRRRRRAGRSARRRPRTRHLHRLRHHPHHRRQLGWRRRAHPHAAGVLAQRAAAQERADVGRDAAPLERSQPVAEPRPAARSARATPGARVGVSLRSGDQPAERRRRLALAHDLGRHPLRDLGKAPGVGHQRHDRVAHDVDEAGQTTLPPRPRSPAASSERRAARRRRSGRRRRRRPPASRGCPSRRSPVPPRMTRSRRPLNGRGGRSPRRRARTSSRPCPP